MKHAGLLLISILLLALPGLPVRAADKPQESQSQALSVNPAIIEVVLAPGKTAKQKIVIANVSDVPIPVKTSVGSFRPNEAVDDGAGDVFRANSWFAIDDPDFILQPQQRKTVAATIAAPSKAEPGGHYATVFFQSLIPEEFVANDRLYLTNRVGVLAFIIIKGDIHESAAIQSFSAPKLLQHGPVDFTLNLKSQGNVHVLPSGKLKLTDWRGKPAGEIPMRSNIVLPHTTREFTFTWNKPRLFGKYTAQAEITYGSTDPQKLVTPTVEVWVIPWVPLAILVFAVLPLLWILSRLRRRWHKVWRAYRG